VIEVTIPEAALKRNVRLRLQVNDDEHEVLFAPYKTLLEVLREDLNLTGTKHGCELGECGACAVLVDGKPVLSCLELALECEGVGFRPWRVSAADPSSIRCRRLSQTLAGHSAATARQPY